MELKLDTEKIKTTGKDLIDLTTELNELLKSLYDKLERISTDSNIWIGESAKKYLEQLKKEKIQYFNMNESIYKQGQFLMEYAEGMQTRIQEMRR